MIPRSIRPVATVPRPVNTSSTGMRNSSRCREQALDEPSTAPIKPRIAPRPTSGLSPSTAEGTSVKISSSASKSLFSKAQTSICTSSTISSPSSSNWSILLMKQRWDIYLTSKKNMLTGLRHNAVCSTYNEDSAVHLSAPVICS